MKADKKLADACYQVATIENMHALREALTCYFGFCDMSESEWPVHYAQAKALIYQVRLNCFAQTADTKWLKNEEEDS